VIPAAVIVLGAIAILCFLYAFWPSPKPPPEPPEIVAHCDGHEWDHGLATACHRPLTASGAHRVARTTVHPEQGGSSASLGFYCAEHCPGDCLNDHCTKNLTLP
jgi:hypothetical protein